MFESHIWNPPQYLVLSVFSILTIPVSVNYAFDLYFTDV